MVGSFPSWAGRWMSPKSLCVHREVLARGQRCPATLSTASQHIAELGASGQRDFPLRQTLLYGTSKWKKCLTVAVGAALAGPRRHDHLGGAVEHRAGSLGAGEPSVAAAALEAGVIEAPHRPACAHLLTVHLATCATTNTSGSPITY